MTKDDARFQPVNTMSVEQDATDTPETPLWLANFLQVYQNLSKHNLDMLAQAYHPNINFTDPIHNIQGLANLQQYFHGMYENLSSCEFVIQQVITQDDQAAIYWQMSYQHPKLGHGKIVTVTGHSHLKAQDDKVIYHRDYLDLGEMLYEQLPILGKLIGWIKSRAAK